MKEDVNHVIKIKTLEDVYCLYSMVYLESNEKSMHYFFKTRSSYETARLDKTTANGLFCDNKTNIHQVDYFLFAYL